MKELTSLPRKLLTAKAVCALLGISRVHLNRLSKPTKDEANPSALEKVEFPKPIRLGRDNRWSEDEIIEFLNKRRGAKAASIPPPTETSQSKAKEARK